MDMNKTWAITIQYSFTSANEPWRQGVMEEGQEAPEVTGGMVELPQGGERQSEAAVTGGIFIEGSEPASHAEENTRKIIDTLLPGEVESRISDFIDGNDSVADLEFFLTNIAKSEYQKIAGEYSDNKDEAKATQMVIDSLKIKVEIEGMPTKEEIIHYVKGTVVDFLNQSIGSGS